MSLKIAAPLLAVLFVAGITFYFVERRMAQQADKLSRQEYRQSMLDQFNSERDDSGEVVDVGLYYDWNIGVGPLYNELLPMVTETLVELDYAGDIVYRLAKELRFDSEVSHLVLKEALFWSDKQPLTGYQVVEAFRRAQLAAKAGLWVPDEEKLRNWLDRVAIDAQGQVINVRGITSEKELREFASSRLLIPIRPDLLQESDLRSPWTTTIGPYALKYISAGGLPRGTLLELAPNPYFYRGRRRYAATISVERLYKSL